MLLYPGAGQEERGQARSVGAGVVSAVRVPLPLADRKED